MGAIHRLHWANVKNCSIDGARGKLFAFWPDLVAHDQRLAEAGVTGFQDTDAEWDKGFEQLVRSLVAALKLEGPEAVQRLIKAATDEHAPLCRTSAAQGAVAVSASGHPIIWVWLADERASTWHASLRSVAAGRPLAETVLDWDLLLPAVFA